MGSRSEELGHSHLLQMLPVVLVRSWCQVAPPMQGGKMAAILQLSQYCTFRMDSISTVITEPGQPVDQAPLLVAVTQPGRWSS